MRVVLVSVMSLLLCAPAWAAATLDQSQELLSGGAGFANGRSLAQTFTAGLSGQLLSIDLNIAGWTDDLLYPSILGIQTTALGLPTGTVLGSVVPTGLTFAWNHIDLSSLSVNVTAGTQYAIVLSNNDPSMLTVGVVNVSWEATLGADAYPGGQLLEDRGTGWQVVEVMSAGGDAEFRTYVDTPSSVPAPGALLLAGIGSLLVTSRRRSL
jgi:hypothetical protein